MSLIAIVMIAPYGQENMAARSHSLFIIHQMRVRRLSKWRNHAKYNVYEYIYIYIYICLH